MVAIAGAVRIDGCCRHDYHSPERLCGVSLSLEKIEETTVRELGI